MYYFIVNPVSSSGKGLRIWQEAREILDDGNVEYESFILEGPGEAAELARFLSLNRTPCTIVVVGGDGTINEFLSGLVTCQGITFGYIPTGSGNDFARGMRLPSRLEDIMAMILSPSKFRNINIGVTSSGGQKKYFAVSSGMGYDAAVCYESYRSPAKYLLNKLHAGKLIYLLNALKLLVSIRPFSIRLIMDDQKLHTYQNVYFVAAMNTRYEGGGFMFCPKASPVDNYLDLIVVEGLSKWKTLLILPTAFKGKHVKFQGIHIFRCRRAVIQSDREVCVHIDGEHFGFCKKVSFGLLKEKLRVIAG